MKGAVLMMKKVRTPLRISGGEIHSLKRLKEQMSLGGLEDILVFLLTGQLQIWLESHNYSDEVEAVFKLCEDSKACALCDLAGKVIYLREDEELFHKEVKNLAEGLYSVFDVGGETEKINYYRIAQKVRVWRGDEQRENSKLEILKNCKVIWECSLKDEVIQKKIDDFFKRVTEQFELCCKMGSTGRVRGTFDISVEDAKENTKNLVDKLTNMVREFLENESRCAEGNIRIDEVLETEMRELFGTDGISLWEKMKNYIEKTVKIGNVPKLDNYEEKIKNMKVSWILSTSNSFFVAHRLKIKEYADGEKSLKNRPAYIFPYEKGLHITTVYQLLEKGTVSNFQACLKEKNFIEAKNNFSKILEWIRPILKTYFDECISLIETELLAMKQDIEAEIEKNIEHSNERIRKLCVEVNR